jgi:class 3 adenylate cyclase
LPVRAGDSLPLGTVRDKRIVTLVYTDMEGSTRLLDSLRDAFLPVLERQRVILETAATAHGGAGYATGGDGCVFLFGSPSSAVAAAVEAQRALRVERWPAGASVRVRMAIHAGEVADLGDELFGMALHHVSRMLGVTHGGQVLLSGAAVGLITELPSGIALRDLGPHRLRDIVRPVRLHQAVAEGIPTAFPPLKTAPSGASNLPAPTSSFVGRERELRELGELLVARRLVTLTGVGGSGKTAWRWRLPGGSRSGIATACTSSSWLASAPTRRCPRPCSARSGCASRRPGGRRASSCAPRWPTATSSSCSTTASTSSPGWLPS